MILTFEQARQVSIVRYLTAQGIFPVYSSGNGQEYHYHSPIRSGDSTPSFHVNVFKNRWHDKGLGKGGDSTELVVEHRRIDRTEARKWLTDSALYCGDYVPEYPSIQKGRYRSAGRNKSSHFHTKPTNPNSEFAKLENDTSFMIETIQKIQHPILLQYLQYRRLNKDIATKYGMLEINYQIFDLPEVSYFALAWHNDSGGLEYNYKPEHSHRKIKGCLGVKDITSINLHPNQKLAVFESAIDFWSYLTHHDISAYNSSAVILNSVSMRHKVMDIVEQYKPSGVYLFLDNDIEGRKATESLLSDIQDVKVYDKSSIYETYSDYNDYLMSILA